MCRSEQICISFASCWTERIYAGWSETIYLELTVIFIFYPVTWCVWEIGLWVFIKHNQTQSFTRTLTLWKFIMQTKSFIGFLYNRPIETQQMMDSSWNSTTVLRKKKAEVMLPITMLHPVWGCASYCTNEVLSILENFKLWSTAYPIGPFLISRSPCGY